MKWLKQERYLFISQIKKVFKRYFGYLFIKIIMTHVQVSVDINLIVENVKKKFDFATGDLIFLNI